MNDDFLTDFINHKNQELDELTKANSAFDYDEFFMQIAFEISEIGIAQSPLYGPFGSCVTKDNRLVSVACNEVQLQNDPSCHAELLAIRRAGKNIQNFDLSGCKIYATGEPCPMCMSGILWANIAEVVYANPVENASVSSGELFKDAAMYQLFKLRTDDVYNRFLPQDCTKCQIPLSLNKIDVKNSDRLYKAYKGKAY